jgi:hypothetical protein
MRLKESRETYSDLTQKASDVSRQLAFASIGIVWFFKKPDAAGPLIPEDLVWPAIAAVLALLFDFLHYFLSVALWGAYHRRKARQLGLNEDKDFYPPRIIILPGEFFFWCKLIAIGIAYVGIGLYAKNLLP